ncbi:proline dehydrogenase family protein [Rhodococcus sp. G-MC3]|uniref:proline dehydrogenase family protein n=1 Tax=Rhodococcus sp. G-MC3 TaxID=3046209 RepID=UPI0024BBE1D2|nr:proline dehydrogenase family protein [Rhodococcus sp. G-MC3]MDJ0396447.1 proline dehydrogenase family protein [Rhodococcus sp. G-MC3]
MQITSRLPTKTKTNAESRPLDPPHSMRTFPFAPLDVRFHMISRMLLKAADNKKLEQAVTTNKLSSALVHRYVGGTTLEQALDAAKRLQSEGIDVSLDLLGEQVDNLEDASVATKEYVEVLHAIAEHVPGATVSVKLSQLGIGVSTDAATENLATLLNAGKETNSLVEVDMEHSSVGRDTLQAFREKLPEFPNTRVAIQAAMRSTSLDLKSFSDVKPRIRLVKGAYAEAIDTCVCDKDEVTAQYCHLTEWALQNLPDPAFGTHDDACIEHVKTAAARLGVSKRNFEFQMLYGVRRDLQKSLVAEGYRVRVYLPYGTQWYPYLMRRMAERPANLLLFLRSLISG